MTVDNSTSAAKGSKPPNLYDNAVADFSSKDYVAPSLFVRPSYKTIEDSTVREEKESAYRAATNPTAWNMYLTLGRYAVDGYIFQAIIEDFPLDSLQAHCVIYYQYSYHFDRQLEIPPLLEKWAHQQSIPFLEKNKQDALLLDTTKASWKDYSDRLSLPHQWTEVAKKSKKKSSSKKFSSKVTTVNSTHDRMQNIPEESSQDGLSASNASKGDTNKEKMVDPSNLSDNKTQVSNGNNRNTANSDDSAASDSKMSALVQSLNVPTNDGTFRVTLRWTLPPDPARTSLQTPEMKKQIYDLLAELFTDDDGYFYKWDNDNLDTYAHISALSPDELRSFLSHTLQYSPSQRIATIPFRYGFAGKTPTKWRNADSTKQTLENKKATVSFSNVKTTSGKLVIAGYILLKAPNTTHRGRYQQSLIKLLPDDTPPFDILLHKRFNGQQIHHLAVQCGEKMFMHFARHSKRFSLANKPLFIFRALFLRK